MFLLRQTIVKDFLKVSYYIIGFAARFEVIKIPQYNQDVTQKY